MSQAFSTALSALAAQGKAIDVVSNNLANLNTPGFKATVVSFEEAMSQTYGAGGTLQVGLGNSVPVTLRTLTQGSIVPSSSTLDAAIRGNGFFIVKDSKGNEYLTRSGMMKMDSSGKLVTATGEAVQGWVNGAIGNVVIPTAALAPQATTTVNAAFNLSSSGTPLSFPVDVYDAAGNHKTLTVNVAGSAGAWKATFTLDGAPVTDGTNPISKDITFNASGVATTSSFQITLTAAQNGGTAQDITFSFVDASNKPTITQTAAPSQTTGITQDGNGSAQFVNARIADGGNVYAMYEGGKEVLVGQLALAAVINPDAFLEIGNMPVPVRLKD